MFELQDKLPTVAFVRQHCDTPRPRARKGQTIVALIAFLRFPWQGHAAFDAQSSRQERGFAQAVAAQAKVAGDGRPTHHASWRIEKLEDCLPSRVEQLSKPPNRTIYASPTGTG